MQSRGATNAEKRAGVPVLTDTGVRNGNWLVLDYSAADATNQHVKEQAKGGPPDMPMPIARHILRNHGQAVGRFQDAGRHRVIRQDICYRWGLPLTFAVT